MAGLLDFFTGGNNGVGLLGLPPSLVNPLQNALLQIANPALAGQRRDSEGLMRELQGILGPQAQPMGSLPAMPQPTMASMPSSSNRIYAENEMNPLDAAVATPKELSVGVPSYVPEQYRPVMGKAAVDSDIPVDVLARQTKQESGFNPNAVSSAGAMGISQFMPGTAREMGINPGDPMQAIPAQAAYLRQNIDKFGGSLPLGLAAYNYGPGNVQKVGGDISRMPAETQGYVRNITGQQPVQVAQAGGAPPVPAQQAQQGAMSPRLQQLIGMAQRYPNLPPQQAKVLEFLIQQELQANAPPKPTDEMREYQLYRQQGGDKSFFDYKADLRKAGATNVQTNVGGGSDKQIFDTMGEMATAARSAVSGMQGLREARQAIQGGAITGFGANQQLAAQKFLAKALGYDDAKVINSETFRSAIAPQVAAVLKATVGTAQISNTDREFALQAAGGTITLDEKSILRVLDIMERASTALIKQHNDRLNKVYPDPEKFARERALFGVEMPAAPAGGNRVIPYTEYFR